MAHASAEPSARSLPGKVVVVLLNNGHADAAAGEQDGSQNADKT
jgi:hypothetical protein